MRLSVLHITNLSFDGIPVLLNICATRAGSMHATMHSVILKIAISCVNQR